MTERLEDAARQLLKPSLKPLSSCSHKPHFCPLLFTDTCMKGFCSCHSIENISLLVNPRAPVCEYQCLTFLSFYPQRAEPVKSSEQYWLPISRHLKSLALRRQRTHHFLKPLQAGYSKKPLITTINLVLIHQVVSRNLAFGDQRDHKHRDEICKQTHRLKAIQ